MVRITLQPPIFQVAWSGTRHFPWLRNIHIWKYSTSFFSLSSNFPILIICLQLGMPSYIYAYAWHHLQHSRCTCTLYYRINSSILATEKCDQYLPELILSHLSTNVKLFLHKKVNLSSASLNVTERFFPLLDLTHVAICLSSCNVHHPFLSSQTSSCFEDYSFPPWCDHPWLQLQECTCTRTNCTKESTAVCQLHQ